LDKLEKNFGKENNQKLKIKKVYCEMTDEDKNQPYIFCHNHI